MDIAQSDSVTGRAVNRAVDIAGSQAALAHDLGVRVRGRAYSATMIQQWGKGVRPVPPKFVPALEAYGLAPWELRPDDWHLIWPHRVGSPGAPKPATVEATGTAA